MAKAIRRLKLGKQQKWLGVCSGLAAYLHLDPTAIRVIWIVMTVLTGFLPGVLIYILVAWVMSEA
jgi:phage shock protein C